MKITSLTSDEVILRELGGRLAAIRLQRNLTQAALAEHAGVSKRAVERLELGKVAMRLSGLVRVCRALGLVERFDALIPEPMPSPIAQLKLKGKERRRASGKKVAASAPKKWTWGDPS
ncbi:MAG: helix-turn-helix domain-containing protein [Verrucomicrobiae bacterium]|nr:helix-turn-helix domain-containing protein [Verrucomicrobiae bacterium]